MTKNIESKPNPEDEQIKNLDYWVDRTVAKALSFTQQINKDLRFDLERPKKQTSGGEYYEDVRLHFYLKRKKGPPIEWTMPIGHSEKYLENLFEELAKKIHDEKNEERDSQMPTPLKRPRGKR